MKYVIATAIVLMLAIGVMVIGPRWANAQGLPPGCGKTKEIFKGLDDKFKEVPIGVGLSTGNELVTVFVSKAGTFTIVVSSPNGVSCIRSSGSDWMGKSTPWGKNA